MAPAPPAPQASPAQPAGSPTGEVPLAARQALHQAEASLVRMQPFASRGLYVNFMGHAGETALRDAYRANYERLVALKSKYDPANFFRFNQNIRPTVQTERGL